MPVLLATGRMFRSVRRYAGEAGVEEPVVCYQGAAVVDPRSGEFLLHEPLELDLAREVIAALAELGCSPNVYVDDELFVARESEASRAYTSFQHLPVTEVGDLLAWLDRPPTKLVAVAEPAVLARIRGELEPRFGDRLHITTSLPYMLELGPPGVTKGSGIAFVAAQLTVELEHVVAFGDGENDVELLVEAGYGVAVDGAHPRLAAVADMTCPGPEDEGVATVIDAVLDSQA